ncbi:phage holin family protein [Aromatoleum aromaticum]|uniref:Transmembrane protein n=1 Tax=Aromatoleum aromaticum (strain DSM 19018 / LMG 30748 / EbN1) TaxID=76114 RepID=Q5P1H2_AROAE|nr:phage holin family protein [Aromatoleum aromaticum]NMG53220.1 phage holin family protein [Aromatoleum aromaticum]CAI08842.1 putative transmembrane protein [Aromatoleum aromaticum EbN1]
MDPRFRLALQWLLNAVALMLLPQVITDLRVDSYAAALVTVLLLALINTLIRPILIFITLPITLLTLGLFTLVINALLFWAVASLVSGVYVPDFWTAFWAALLYSLLAWLASVALSGRDGRQVRIVTTRRRN